MASFPSIPCTNHGYMHGCHVLINQEVLGEGEPKVDHLLECPDHLLATFVKGKPWSILTSYVFLYQLESFCFMLMH